MTENTDSEIKTEESTEIDSQVRTARTADDREVAQRVESWENPSNLPNPDPQPGWVFRWIRTSLLGTADNPNVSKQFRSGWTPCRAEDHPELHVQMMDHKSEWAERGHIEIGGLLLCKMPQEKADARTEHFSEQAKNQMESVDNAYFKDQDSRMATKQVFERKSKTTFGSDS